MEKADSAIGCLLGTAIGDAIGLPFEGLSKCRQRRIYREINGHKFLFGRGMVSDDTEHSCMVAQSIIVSAGDTEIFTNQLAMRSCFWLLGLPAGIGYATLRAILKLWLGFPSSRSGVFSAGNGPAMRSAIIGVCYGNNSQKLRELVRASTRLTHTDPKAEYGALAVAIAAYISSCQEAVSPQSYYQTLQEVLGEEAKEFLELIKKAVESAAQEQTTESFAEQLGLKSGVSGYVYHTVPVAIHAWFKYPKDYQVGVREIIRCGGDTDTTAAILGGIIGAGVGKTGIPQHWLDGLWESPRSVKWMEKLGRRLADVSSRGDGQKALPLPVMILFLRNLFFMLVVILHGFRRLLPPY
ncbi:ADP-ribosylglycohydrolase family protein [Cyanobacteria bacterium FACHB-472]|nr:ADP-ribosylglycohydrolase family protein [Cyanobacteria bacterium FACHB-472]